MPAGNDQKDALSELADKFGMGQGRAEDLIAANQERFSGLLGKAQLQGRDDEATAELDKADVAKSAGVDEDDLLDYSVRGDAVVYAYNDEDGRVQKDAFLVESVGKAASTAEKEAAEATATDTEDEEEDEKPKAKSRSRTAKK